MVISVVLDTEYMGVAERNKWFLKSVSNAMKEDTIIITHAYFKNHLREVVEGCADRFYTEFEMDRVPPEEIEKLDICYIPDVMFDSIYDEYGSKTKQLIFLFNERIGCIERYIVSFVDKALEKRGVAKPDFIMNCLHTFASIKYLAEYYDCPLIPYVFSAIRKVHGYSGTLYMAHIGTDLFNSESCIELYEGQKDKDLGFPVMNKEEILALMGKKHNIPLLPLLRRNGIYEVGVVGEGFRITPEIYQKDPVTDDDLYFESKRLFHSQEIITRQHPMQLDQVGIGRSHMKNDPAAFLLSCNRVVTVQSQMIMKAAIWNRAAVAMSNALPYAFLLNNKLSDAKPIDDFDLNFILFIYFVPDSCMFSTDYWKWRMSKPQASEIAKKHIETILSDLSIPVDTIRLTNGREEEILRYRGFSDEQIDEYLNPVSIQDVPYDYPTSCIKCHMDDGAVFSLYCLNHKTGSKICSTFEIPKGCVYCDFVPQSDCAGYVCVDKVTINDRLISINDTEKYCSKNQPVISIELEGKSNYRFDAKWSVKSYNL